MADHRLAFASWGVRIDTNAHSNVIGGPGPGEGNVISGATIGVFIQSGPSNNVIGNLIGTDEAGTAGMTNSTGVYIQGPAANNIVGGDTAGERNVIAASTNEGIVVQNSNGNMIKGNHIGTDAAGTLPLPNAVGIGVYDSDNTVIGGQDPGERNLVSGNTAEGVWIDNSGGNNATGHVVLGNLIGTDVSGQSPMPNGSHGVRIENSDGNDVGGLSPGQGNVVANSGGDGVYVGVGATGNAIRGNSIHSNTGLGVNSVGGGNMGVASPVITGSGSASGNALACPNCSIDIFSDSADEGRMYHGSTFTDSGGFFLFAGPTFGPNVTATVTDAGGNTSEFSAPFACTDGDADGVCTSWDNCPSHANAGQEDRDSDIHGDACDNCPDWANTGQGLPSWPVPANDADCDGFTDAREQFLETSEIQHCNATATSNDEASDMWPPDFNDNRFTTLADVLLFGSTYHKVEANNDGYLKRFDLNQSGAVTLADIITMGPFYNKSCA